MARKDPAKLVEIPEGYEILDIPGRRFNVISNAGDTFHGKDTGPFFRVRLKLSDPEQDLMSDKIIISVGRINNAEPYGPVELSAEFVRKFPEFARAEIIRLKTDVGNPKGVFVYKRGTY